MLHGSALPPPKPPAKGFGSDCPGNWKPPGEGAPPDSLPGSLNEGGPPGGFGGSAEAAGREKGEELVGGAPESGPPPEPGNLNPAPARGAEGFESGSLNPEDGGSPPPEPGNWKLEGEGAFGGSSEEESENEGGAGGGPEGSSPGMENDWGCPPS